MIVGYTLFARGENGATFFAGDEPPGTLCPQCGTCLDYNFSPERIEVSSSRSTYDVSTTVDARKLFSRRFVDFCVKELGCDDSIHRIASGAAEFYYLFPRRVLQFDSAKRRTRFSNKCIVCEGYGSVVGAHPSFYKTGAIVSDAFHRSDLAFGSQKAKFPLLVVSPSWKVALETQRFRGIEFEAVHGFDTDC
jgi:hypothetical protein